MFVLRVSQAERETTTCYMAHVAVCLLCVYVVRMFFSAVWRFLPAAYLLQRNCDMHKNATVLFFESCFSPRRNLDHVQRDGGDLGVREDRTVGGRRGPRGLPPRGAGPSLSGKKSTPCLCGAAYAVCLSPDAANVICKCMNHNHVVRRTELREIGTVLM